MNVCPVLVGRDVELDALCAALPSGGFVLVAGEAGIGKSRLLREFAARAESQGHPVVWGRPEAVAGSGPYSLVLDLLDDVASVARHGSDDARELASTISDPSRSGADPPARQIAARLRGIFAQLGAHPVVMLEDLQGADELSHAVLAHLARSSRDDGVLIVGTYRSEEASVEPLGRLLDLVTRDRIASELTLAPLGERATAEMVRAMWGTDPHASELAAIARLGEGVPFFIEELAAARAAGGGAVPASIARAVQIRLSRLDPSGVAVIRAASLALGPLDPGVLADVCGVPETKIPQILIAAVVAGLLAEQEGRLVFRHALVREAIEESIVSLERADIHARLASAIEKRHADQLEQHAHALARHHAEAGAHVAATEYWVMAGRRSLDVAALEEARAAFQAALDLSEDDRTRRAAMAGMADVLVRFREFEEATDLLREVAEGARASGEAAEAARALGSLSQVYLSFGEHAAIEVLDEALTLLADEPDDALVAELLIDKGYALARIFEDPIQGEALLAEGARRAEALDDLALRAQALEGLAWISELKGRADEAHARGEEACRLAMASGRGVLVGKTFSNEAVRLALHGKCSDALRHLDRAREELSARMGSGFVVSLDHLRAWVLWRMGAPAEADRYASRLEASMMAQQYGRVVRAWAAVERGDVRLARSIVSSWWRELGDDAYRERAALHPEEVADGSPSLFAILAELIVRVMTEDVDAFTLDMARAYHEFCKLSTHEVSAQTAILHARARITTGDFDQAEEILDGAETYLRSHRYPLHAAGVAETRGLLDVVRDDHVRARKHFELGTTLYREAENGSDRARCTRLWAAALLRAGERDEAAARLSEARELAAEAGATVELNKIEARMRELGARPRAGRPRGPRRPEGSLSAREEEVVALVAAGASNGEVAARLFLSERTVEDHIANAQRRLGLTGRAALAAWAAKQGLV
ncbi:MAG: AAA family ATPase [Actinomycetota bacterium]